jgi:redox-regulated HSP33 family molecular chaperone
MVTVEGLDVFLILEQFFRQSEQVPARFLELSDTRMVMVQGLPRSDAGWIRGLERDEAEELLEAEPEPIETRGFRLHCGCDGDRMARALVQFFRVHPEGLFEGEDGAETSCPRCGARWWIDRDLFERTAAAHPELGA